jgi:hypothetical protein
MENKIVKFREFTNTNEHTYKPDINGKMIKQEWELYKDWHPAKFKVSSLTISKDIAPFEGEFVWVIKRNDNIISIFSSIIDQEKIKIFFDALKKQDVEYTLNNDVVSDGYEDSNL